MAIPRRKKRSISLDMTPMIDCVFQLLIFFLLTSSLVSPQLRLVLPRAATQDESTAPEVLVSVDADGAMFVNQSRVTEDELHDALKPLLEKARQKIVTFRGDRKTPHEVFVRVLDASRRAGAATMNIAHQGEP